MSSFTKTIIVDQTDPNYPNTIQEGVSLLPTEGGVVYVESGEYIIDSDTETVKIPSNTTLIGRGNVVVKVTQPGTELNPINAFRNANLSTGNTNITITGFKIQVACENNPYRSHLIFLQNVSNCRLEKLYIEDVSAYGVYRDTTPTKVEEYVAIYIYSNGHNCKNNTIIQCRIKNFGKDTGALNFGYGICFNTQNAATGICCDSIVKNNYITNCLTNLYSAHSERILIRGNIFRESRVCHINITQCKNWIIKGNQMNFADSEIGSHGVYLSGCEGSIIAGNIVHNNRKDGIKLRHAGELTSTHHCTVVGNVCMENVFCRQIA
jgi:parallel beta-helix repeat protein